jgi:hypothetical protein
MRWLFSSFWFFSSSLDSIQIVHYLLEWHVILISWGDQTATSSTLLVCLSWPLLLLLSLLLWEQYFYVHVPDWVQFPFQSIHLYHYANRVIILNISFLSQLGGGRIKWTFIHSYLYQWSVMSFIISYFLHLLG